MQHDDMYPVTPLRQGLLVFHLIHGQFGASTSNEVSKALKHLDNPGNYIVKSPSANEAAPVATT